MKQSMEKACPTDLNRSGWENSGVYPFEHAPVWRVHKVDIKVSAAEFAAAAPLTPPIKSSVPQIDLNTNAMDALTTTLATELDRKHRRAETISTAQAEIVPGSDSETETEEEDNNHTGTVSLRDSALPKKTSKMECGQVIFVWSWGGSLVTLC